MALVVAQKPNASESSLQSALAAYFNWERNECFPSVSMWAWEQDMVVLTEAGKVWEVEVKISMADWKADLKKDKWESQDWKKVSRMYYCVPRHLLGPEKKIPEFVPDYVGVLVADDRSGRWVIKEVREAKNRSTFKISPQWRLKLYRSTYFRFWRTRKHDPMLGVFTQTQEPVQSIAET